jgi:hypothetical protein
MDGSMEYFHMLYVPRKFPETQKTNIRRAISDLEEHCSNIPEKQQFAVKLTIERFRFALTERQRSQEPEMTP